MKVIHGKNSSFELKKQQPFVWPCLKIHMFELIYRLKVPQTTTVYVFVEMLWIQGNIMDAVCGAVEFYCRH